ncbi:polysulfide reductase NrfD [Vibrio sp. SS-MA-C1-2]|uniref:NrfD/PsrC family molybdoenzyme membrane anchor subunit n=1 Tax=Vibrio sp. SS-MA-C1-2 TaxID=2908646 RepID=UPI001F1AD371|nr:NrfD/PsrC family molybdoenzyme membrane anchor subunit [Vibrio sp. SS-MA-C1-2]UJF17349.1 polysulfide reductase NrfD [Vibrio sp. SS-MA-C1-2]
MNITEVLVQPQPVAWLPWAVQYFFYIGSAYAAAILFFIALICKTKVSHYFRSSLALTLAIGAVVGPLALTADLHQPGRAWHFYTNLTPWSWMSMGSIFLPIFSGLAVVTAWLYLRNDLMLLRKSDNFISRKFSLLSLGQWQTSYKLLVMVSLLTLLSGLSIALYTGAEVAVLHSRPLWNQPASPLLWFASSFLVAIGFSLIIYLMIAKGKFKLSLTDICIIKRTIIISSLSSGALLSLWATQSSHLSLYNNSMWLTSLLWLFTIFIICTVVTLILINENYKVVSLIVLSILTLLSAWYIRWVTLIDVQLIPKFDVGLYPYHLTTGSGGILSIIGMLGLWSALALLGSELISSKCSTSTFSHHNH